MLQTDKDVQPWRMDNLPVKEDNNNLGLIVSGYMEEENRVDKKVKKARGSLFKLLGPAFSSKCFLSPAVQLHLFRIYICPIARSGLSAMALSTTHIYPFSACHKKIIKGFLHFSDKAPVPSLHKWRKNPPTKSEYSGYILTKITLYHEKQLRMKWLSNKKLG